MQVPFVPWVMSQELVGWVLRAPGRVHVFALAPSKGRLPLVSISPAGWLPMCRTSPSRSPASPSPLTLCSRLALSFLGIQQYFSKSLQSFAHWGKNKKLNCEEKKWYPVFSIYCLFASPTPPYPHSGTSWSCVNSSPTHSSSFRVCLSATHRWTGWRCNS